MTTAAHALRPNVKDQTWRLLIGGKLVPASQGDETDVLDPARGEIVCRIPEATADDVDAAARAALGAFASWRLVPAAERAACVARIADVIEAHGEELARLDTLDGGSPLKAMRGDCRIAVSQLRYFAGLALQLRGETIPTPEASSLDFTRHEPYGVVARIVPFNHPLMFAATALGAPLIAGNTVIVKPSEHTSLSALRLGALIADCVPPGVVNIVTGAGTTVGDALVRHPAVRRISFVGGVATGRAIQRAAAEAGVKTVTLELGGKNPMVVFADCDIEAAIAGAVRGMNFAGAGQSCGSTSRLFIHRSVFARVLDGVRTRMEALKVGDPFDETSDVGTLAFPAHFERVCRFFTEARADPRAKLMTGGVPESMPHRKGLYFRPTLFALESDDVPIAETEVFGPILVAMPFDDYGEVIARANRLPVGLTASVWTRDLSTAMKASRDLEAGYVWVNGTAAHIPGAAFGGVKDSGIGREEGIEELLGYTQQKNIYIRYGSEL